jgi:hypothetical protein
MLGASIAGALASGMRFVGAFVLPESDGVDPGDTVDLFTLTEIGSLWYYAVFAEDNQLVIQGYAFLMGDGTVTDNGAGMGGGGSTALSTVFDGATLKGNQDTSGLTPQTVRVFLQRVA